MTLTPGTRLGPYEITALLGVGGMGEVYRARDTKLQRDVALKVLPDSFANDSDRLARFQREAQVLASLNHPNIAHIHGLEENGDVRALVMELVEGEDLAQRLTRGAIPIDEALPIAKQIAEALEAAHEQGIIHRDLKPANIKVRADGTVKVLDFGLAKAVDPALGSGPTAGNLTASPTLALGATSAGIILGTAAYMAPEQARGKAVDKRIDIWAFGCTLYEILTGTPAFSGDDLAEILGAVIHKTPEWDRLPTAVSATVRTVLRRCLEKDPKERLRDIGDVQLALTGAFEAPQSSTLQNAASPSEFRWAWWLTAMAATALLASTVSIFVWRTTHASPQRIVTRLTLPLPEGQLLGGTASRRGFTISPDGRQIAYTSNQRLYVRSISEDLSKPIAGSELPSGAHLEPAFSPDGGSISYWEAGITWRLKKIPVGGGSAVTLYELANIGLGPFGTSWDENGILFCYDGRTIVRVAPGGGQPTVLLKAQGEEQFASAQLLPGGKALIFTATSGNDVERWNRAHIAVQILTSGERKTLIETGTDPRYLPTGHLVYAVGGTLFAVPFDADRVAVVGGSVPVVEGVKRATAGVASHFAISNTGTLIYSGGPIGVPLQELALIDRKGNTEPLGLPSGIYEQPRISPDGQRVAFYREDGKDVAVWIADTNGTTLSRRLTFEGSSRYPVWSADSKRVAFQSDRGGDLGIFSQAADGSAPAERLTKADKNIQHIPEAWSRDDTIIYSAVARAGVSLWTFSPRGRTAPAPFDSVRSSRPTTATLSADGRWLAYYSDETGKSIIYVQPFPATGAKYQISSGDSHHPAWSRDGKELFFVPGPAQLSLVRVSAQPGFSVGNPVALPTGGFSPSSPNQVRGYDVTPDGRILAAVAAGEPRSSMTSLRIIENWFDELKIRVPTNQ